MFGRKKITKMKLVKKIWSIYKIQLLLSLTLFIALLALTKTNFALDIAQIFLGCLVGTFILDLDYVIYAFFTDPNKDFSVTLKGYFRHKDFANALSYIFYHKNEVKEKTLHSALFQVVLCGLTFFLVFAPLNLFTKALIITGFGNSLYRMAEAYHSEEDQVYEWFWMLKEKPSLKGVKVYLLMMTLAFAVLIQFL